MDEHQSNEAAPAFTSETTGTAEPMEFNSEPTGAAEVQDRFDANGNDDDSEEKSGPIEGARGENARPSSLATSPQIKALEEWELGLPVSDLGKHILRLRLPANPAAGEQDGFDLEFNYIEKKSETDSFFGDYDSAMRPFNRPKNRYSNVLPLEKTRVQLNKKKGDDGEEIEDSDYINANWVNGFSEKEYISTQGPLQETVEDFWRMVWETTSNVVVMLTKEMENDRLKCARYWPQQEGNAFTFDDITVKLIKETGSFNGRLVHRELEIFTDTERRPVSHFQYMDWPDHGLPESAEAFIDVLHSVDKIRTAKKAPIVVHCSAGIGRTGTFCAVHSTLEKLDLLRKENPNESPMFNVLKTVLRLREQRVGMVQTKEQYVFCYKALLEEAQKRGWIQTPVGPHVI